MIDVFDDDEFSDEPKIAVCRDCSAPITCEAFAFCVRAAEPLDAEPDLDLDLLIPDHPQVLMDLTQALYEIADHGRRL